MNESKLIAAAKKALFAMEAFCGPEQNVPEKTLEFNQLKEATIGLQIVLRGVLSEQIRSQYPNAHSQKHARIYLFKQDIQHAKTEELKREWDLWMLKDDESLNGVDGVMLRFHYEAIHAELNRRGEGEYCAV